MSKVTLPVAFLLIFSLFAHAEEDSDKMGQLTEAVNRLTQQVQIFQEDIRTLSKQIAEQ
jgi:tRNA1(Val) A37 N6-methylase TrmN6